MKTKRVLALGGLVGLSMMSFPAGQQPQKPGGQSPPASQLSVGGCKFASQRSGPLFTFTFTRRDAAITDDGRGTYVHGREGVMSSLQNAGARLFPFVPSQDVHQQRSLLVNLSRPVSPTTQTAYGRILRSDSNFRVHWRTDDATKTIYSILDIPVGAQVTTDRVEASVMLHGRQHLRRFGALDLSVCWLGRGLHGKDTSEGRITRVSKSEWAVDLPVGSRGRLWDLNNRATDTLALLNRPANQNAGAPIDRGLYFADAAVTIKLLEPSPRQRP